MIPQDPYILLSFLNMKLRDGDLSLEELCGDLGEEREVIAAKLAAIGYVYSEAQNTFVPEDTL